MTFCEIKRDGITSLHGIHGIVKHVAGITPLNGLVKAIKTREKVFNKLPSGSFKKL